MKNIKILLLIVCLFLIPTIVLADTLPSKYDLRNVNGKSYITPFKDQGNEGLCWDFGAMAHLESRVLKEKNKAYDSTATIFSEKQIVYAAGAVITNGKRAYNKYECEIDSGHVGDGGGFSCAAEVMLDGLGAVTNNWDVQNQNAISNNNAQVDSTIVYNFDNSLYELDTTIEYPTFNTSKLSKTDRTSILNAIKQNIITYGGGVISTDVGYNSRGMYGGKDVMVVASAPDSSSFGGAAGHAMQVIGWDDDYEYMVCKRSSGYAYPPSDCPNDYVTGKGVWIVKNSWKDDSEDQLNSIVLIGYDTNVGTSFDFFKDLSQRTWDNYYQLDSKYINSTSRSFFFKDNEYITNETISKIKLKLLEANHYEIYFSEKGDSNYVLLAKIDTDNILKKKNFEEGREFIGYYSWNLSSKSYHINNNSKFKVVDGFGNYALDFRVYTNNVSNNPNVKVKDIIYDKNTNTGSTYSFVIDSSTKNIKDKETLTYKIIDPNGNYLNTDYYSYDYNKVYANINSSKFKLTSSGFKNGTYIIETYFNDTLLSSSNLVVKDSATKNITKYTLTYDSIEENDCSKPSKTVYIGEKWGELCTPIKKDYKFDGWWTEKTGGSKIDSDTVPESSITAYAHWVYNQEIISPETTDDTSNTTVDTDDSSNIAVHTDNSSNMIVYIIILILGIVSLIVIKKYLKLRKRG